MRFVIAFAETHRSYEVGPDRTLWHSRCIERSLTVLQEKEQTRLEFSLERLKLVQLEKETSCVSCLIFLELLFHTSCRWCQTCFSAKPACLNFSCGSQGCWKTPSPESSVTELIFPNLTLSLSAWHSETSNYLCVQRLEKSFRSSFHTSWPLQLLLMDRESAQWAVRKLTSTFTSSRTQKVVAFPSDWFLPSSFQSSSSPLTSLRCVDLCQNEGDKKNSC